MTRVLWCVSREGENKLIWKRFILLTIIMTLILCNSSNAIRIDDIEEKGECLEENCAALHARSDTANIGISFTLENAREFKIANGMVFVNIYEGGVSVVKSSAIVALDESSGKELWRFKTKEFIQSFELSGGVVFVKTFFKDGETTSGRLVALDGMSGNQLWQTKVNDWIEELLFSDFMVFIVEHVKPNDNSDFLIPNLIALDKNTGKELWRLEREISFISLKYSSGIVFVYSAISENGNRSNPSLMARDEKTGKELWRFEMGRIESFELSGGIVFLNMIGRLFALDEKTGKEIWQYKPVDVIESFELSGGVVYVDPDRGRNYHSDYLPAFVVLDAKTGRELWRFETESRETINFIKVLDGILYLETFEGDTQFHENTSLVALNKITGGMLWRSDTYDLIDSMETHGDSLFVKTSDYNEEDIEERMSSCFSSLNRKTGVENWCFEVDDGGIRGFAVAEYAAIASLENGGIAIVNLKTGATKEIIRDCDEESCHFILSQNMLYVGANNKFYQYDLKIRSMKGVNETLGNIIKMQMSEGIIWTLTEDDTFYAFILGSNRMVADNADTIIRMPQTESLHEDPEVDKEALLSLVNLNPGIKDAWPLLFKACEKTGDVTCMTRAFMNIDLRTPDIPEYGNLKDAWLRHSPYSEIGMYSLFPASTQDISVPQSVIFKNKHQTLLFDSKSENTTFNSELWDEYSTYEVSDGIVFVRPWIPTEAESDDSPYPILIALNQNNGKEMWRFESDEEIGSFNVFNSIVLAETSRAIPDNEEYDNLYTRVLVALNQRSGAELWRFETMDDFHLLDLSANAAFLLMDSVIENEEVDEMPSFLVALNRTTGKELWRFNPDGRILIEHSSGAVFVSTCVSDSEYELYDETDCDKIPILLVLDENTGKEIWRFETDGELGSFDIFDNAVFVHAYKYVKEDNCGLVNSIFVALNGKTGKELWRFETDSWIDSYKIIDGLAIVETEIKDAHGYRIRSGLLAFDENTGKELWRIEPLPLSSYTPFENHIFVEIDNFIVAFDKNTGKEIWRFEPENALGSFKIHNNIVLVETYTGSGGYSSHSSLIALDGNAGKELWRSNFEKASTFEYFGVGDNLFIDLSLLPGKGVAIVMDMRKAYKLIAEGKKWW